MHVFYLVALLFVALGLFLWVRSSKIVATEMLLGGLAAFAMAGIFHFLAYVSVTADEETLSSQASHILHEPDWTERVEYTTTDSKGRTQRHTSYVYHPDEWYCYNIDKSSFEISNSKFKELRSIFLAAGSKVESHFRFNLNQSSGSLCNYTCACPFGLVIPTTRHQRFENRIKAGPTAFEFEKIDPEDKTIPSYPSNGDHFKSNRVMWEAKKAFTTKEWDLLNTRLGPTKKVNLIIVGFPEKYGPDIARKTRAKWIGGKKNDLVLCYGGPEGARWADVFGWTKSELCKANLRSLLVAGPIDSSLIPKIEEEVSKNYTIRNWREFDYIVIEPPLWSILTFVFFIVATQAICYYFFFLNDLEKGKPSRRPKFPTRSKFRFNFER